MSAPVVDRVMLRDCPCPLGIAVSGGSDSTALLVLACEVLGADAIRAVTVDHGLRAQAREEAAQVAVLCRGLGVVHDVVSLDLENGSNIQARARSARYEALAGWARRAGIAAVALGHTQDDLAETFLMRMARGSGVSGLAAMRARFERQGVQFVRPVLEMTRAQLRAVLQERGVSWCEDPTNQDQSHTRVQFRTRMGEFADLGLTSERLAQTAQWMRAAEDVLEDAARDWLGAYARTEHGDAVFELSGLEKGRPETVYRCLAQAIVAISGRAYRPRFSVLSELLERRGGTVQGCLFYRHKDTLRVTREVRSLEQEPDPRWRISGESVRPDDRLRVLGEDGLAQIADWRETAVVPRRSLLSSPSLWRGDTVIAAPLARPVDGIEVSLPDPFTGLARA